MSRTRIQVVKEIPGKPTSAASSNSNDWDQRCSAVKRRIHTASAMSEEEKLVEECQEDSNQEPMTEEGKAKSSSSDEELKPGASRKEAGGEAEMLEEEPEPESSKDQGVSEAEVLEEEPQPGTSKDQGVSEAEVLEEEPQHGTSKDQGVSEAEVLEEESQPETREDQAMPKAAVLDEEPEPGTSEDQGMPEAEVLEEEPEPGTNKDQGVSEAEVLEEEPETGTDEVEDLAEPGPSHADPARNRSPFKFPASPEKRKSRRQSPLKRAVENFFRLGPKLPPASSASPTKVAARTAEWAEAQRALVEESDLEPPESPDLLPRLELDTATQRQIREYFQKFTDESFGRRVTVYEKLPDEVLEQEGIRTKPPLASSEDLSSTPTSTPGTSRPPTSHAFAATAEEHSPHKSPTPPPQRPTNLPLETEEDKETEEDERSQKPQRKGEPKK